MKNLQLRLTLVTAFLLVLSQLVTGQSYKLNEFPPLDPAVRTGVLDNGMHYYLRANKLPENRGEFYIATNIGAIEEDDDQNGLAHFTEHMAFNGTKNFPKKGILDYLATIGVKFGQNVNAGTGVEQTIYNLSNVPLSREGIIDTALLVLHDWAHYLSFEPDEVELERGVIREEWRMYGSADERMDNLLAPVIYKGSKYAKRNVIGDTAVINHFKHETIKRFYHDWYRPDLQAIVLVGDFDLDVLEPKVKKLFNQIPKVENPLPKGKHEVPDNIEPLVGTATDKEATTTRVNVYFKHEPVKDSDKNLHFMRIQLVRGLINNMFGQRMNELSRAENAPFTFAYSYYGGFTRTKDAFAGIAEARNNEGDRALKALLTEMERMKRFGFTAGELERAKANTMRNYESRFLDRNKRKNREVIYPILFNFLINNPNPGIEYEYPFAQSMMPGITLEEINQTSKKYVRDDNMIVTITGPEQEGITIPGEKEIRQILNNYLTADIGPYVDKMEGKKLLDKEPVAGTVIKKSSNQILGTTEWELSNGMKIIFKPTDFKEDELIFKGYSPGGQSLLKNEDLPAADFLGYALYDMGVGNFNRTDLNKMMAGKRVNVSASLSDELDIITGRTSPKDLETALQLVYLYFTQVRWDETDFMTWKEKIKAEYVNADSEPRKAFGDTVTVMLNNHSPRALPMTYRLLNQVTFLKMKEIYQDRFSDPGNFTFQFVGKINPDEAVPLVEKYLASLPTMKRSEVYKDDGVRPPKGKVTNDFRRENTTPRTSVLVSYHGKASYSFDDWMYGGAIRHALELRYVESIREDEGGTYSVRVSYRLNRNPEPAYMMNVSFETDPLKADKLIDIVHREIDKMVAEGPREIDLQKAREYFLKQRQEDLKENNWWNGVLSDYYYNGLDYITGYEEKVKSLDVKSVHDYARKLLSQGNSIEVVMRP